MQRAKTKRSAYKKGHEAVDKYVGIIYEIHQQTEKRRATKSITTIAVKNNASKSLGSVMKRLKIVKGRFPYYHWIGGEPNRKMARDILNAMQLYANNDLVKVEAYKKPKPTRKPKPQPKPKAQQKPRTISMFWGLIKINY
jgi:hypothetical protein